MRRIGSAFCRVNGGMRASAVFVLFATTAISLPAQVFTTLHNFNYDGLGANPEAGLVQAANGNLYGTTQTGGEINHQPNGFGIVFGITLRGIVTTLHVFAGPDGRAPQSGLVLAYGQLYGTTFDGGANSGANLCSFGCGTIFKMAPDGTLTTLHSFNGTDGYHPSTLIQAKDGDFYGTTYFGGTTTGSSNCSLGCGTVFKITPDGTLTTLYSFCSQANCADGQTPVAGLVQADNGDFYGTTSYDGTNEAGTIFEVTPAGTLTTLYNFCSQANCADGSYPAAAMVQTTNGDLYGTTGGGGLTNPFPCFDGCGTVFKITSSGALTTLYSFTGETDGERPYAALIQAGDGNFYGTTSIDTLAGGTFGGGTIFKITPTGKLTTLHDFNAQTDGAGVQTPLLEARSGTFYGTALDGGTDNAGTVFTLEVFVKTLPNFGEVGCVVKILGTNLSGATGVTFNGTPAIFEVVSAHEIVTTVPPGASTGEVEVVTPGGKIWSNGVFRVP